MTTFIDAIDTEIDALEAEQREIEARLTVLTESVNKLHAFRADYPAIEPPDRKKTEREKPAPKKAVLKKPKSVPTGTPKVKRPAVIPSSRQAEKPEREDPNRKQQVLNALKEAGEPQSSAQIRARTGIGQGALTQVIVTLRDAGKIEKIGERGPAVKYTLGTGAPQPPEDGRPAPLPPPARTELQNRISMLVKAMPLMTVEIAKELGSNVLKVENACEALKKRGEIEIIDGTWRAT